MREFKFRAWEKKIKRMWVVRDWDFAHGWIEVKDATGGDCPDVADVEIMQYTGLKDKNGVEIYEGDILSFKPPVDVNLKKINVKVSFVDGAFMVVTEGFEWLLFSMNKKNKIVGNIYENPKLLS